MFDLFYTTRDMRTVCLTGGRVYLRPPLISDFVRWEELRRGSRNFLVPWEPTWAAGALTRNAFKCRLRNYRNDWLNGRGYTFFIFERKSHRLLGGVTLGKVNRGTSGSGTIGYWMGEPYAGKGFMKDALPAVLAFAFEKLKLHRLEAACLPGNVASKSVLGYAGFKQEGLARKYLKINGEWEDHLTFGLLSDDAWRKPVVDSSHPASCRFSEMLQAFVLLVVLSLSLLGAGVRDARAAASGWQEMEQLSVRLLSDRDALGEGEVIFALEQVLQKGWKTYWRSPGDAGFPLSVDWSGSENVESLEILWPAPYRFVLFGFQTFGYSDRVVFPLAVKPKDTSQPLALRLTANYLICEEVCIPYSNVFEMTLQPGKDFQSLEANLVEEALKTVPELQNPGVQSPSASFRSLSLQGSGEDLVLAGTIFIPGGSLPTGSDVLVEGPAAFLYSAPEFRLTGDGENLYSFAIAVTSTDDRQVLEGKRLTLTYVNAEQENGTEWTELARFNSGNDATSSLSGRLFEVLLFAVLGGLILNVMPCVLPVLSLKFLSLLNKADREKSETRKGFLVTVSGIFVSFWGLALGAILLKVLGLSAGWGIQFQQPVFLAFMALVVVFFAANLFGFFEIGSVGALNDLAVRESQSKGVKGDFAAGVFATLLATPCSAPFLGTSVAFALAGGSFEILAIFTALGFGMALPYLLVAFFPGLAAVMPKPGIWMVRVKQIMGLALIATAVWLLSVVRLQSGVMVTVLIALALVALLVVLWALRHKTQAKRVMVVLVSVFTLAVPLGLTSTVPVEVELEENWTVFDEQRIYRLVAEGKTVFVDVTADWCITCQLNKRLVLSDDQVQQAFEAGDVILMKADWTNPDPVIPDYLKANGRYGIPFNIVYGPSSADGIALSEILSVDEVLGALQIAGKPDA